ncbi:PaaX family transcriptional regulator C-terminal domain-containing protein [Microbaculum marinum]|uniref:PaaX family transcriptional regulator C-terminal domain-containing protein n=1 Tax=Microbaculum marinum TaxID=1764581 RepID=A0AAW9RTF9_9HYPH
MNAAKRLRVWSVVITVFGDAVIPRGGMIGMAALQDLTTRMGVAPGALRAAMSRLAKDGWVVRLRHGRRSYYRLSRESAATSIAAGDRFYAAGPPGWDGSLEVAIAPEEPAGERDARTATMAGAGFVRIGNGTYIRPGRVADAAAIPKDMFVLAAAADAVPDWVTGFVSDPDVAQGYTSILADFGSLDAALARGSTLSPLDAVVARTLLIHDWRRVVLRDAALPNRLRPRDWPGEDARSLVKRLYRRLLEPSERWLDQCDGRPDAPLPKPGAMLAQRFGGGI